MLPEWEIFNELKSKINLIEVAFSYIQSGTENMHRVENLISSVQEKLALLEIRLSNLLSTLNQHMQFKEEKLFLLEKRIIALELKENLMKHTYQPHNLKN